MSETEQPIEWYLARNGQQHGPLTDAEVHKLAELGHLRPTDLVWRQGFPDWQPAPKVFAPPPPPPPPPQRPAMQSPAAAPVAARPSAAQPTPAPSAPAPRAPQAVGQMPGQAMGARSQPVSAEARPAAQPQARQPDPRSQAAAQRPSTPQPTYPGPLEAQAARMAPSQQAAARQPSSDREPVAGVGPAPSRPMPVNGQEANRRPAPVDIRDPLDPTVGDDGRSAAKGSLWIKVVAVLVIAVAIGAGAAFWARGSLGGGFGMVTGLFKSEPTAPATPVVKAPAAPLRQQVANQLQETPAAAPGAPVAAAAAPPAAPTPPGPSSVAEIDAGFQQTPLWRTLKKNFPDWYQARLQDVARIRSESGNEQAVAAASTQALVKLRRDNAGAALSASPQHLKRIASTFLDNLIRLSQTSINACYGFISGGETDPSVMELQRSADIAASLQMQLAAVFDAIANGKKSPQQHQQAKREDFDALAAQLGQRGWKPSDLQLFSDARALSKAPQDVVCKMVQDWFAAQLSIKDEAIQIRLLVETLKPVIAG